MECFLCQVVSFHRSFNPINEPFALRFCGERDARVPEVIRANSAPVPFSAYFKGQKPNLEWLAEVGNE